MAHKFPIGQVVATRGVFEQLSTVEVGDALRRHMAGDWGDVCEADRQANEDAMINGGRLFSVYHARGVKFWIITEADGSATNVELNICDLMLSHHKC
jgi:hypothetical protein